MLESRPRLISLEKIVALGVIAITYYIFNFLCACCVTTPVNPGHDD